MAEYGVSSNTDRLSLEEALEYADQMRRDTTCVGLPNWPERSEIADAARHGETIRLHRNLCTGEATVPCAHGTTARPDVTGDPVKACANAASTTEWGAFNAEGCTYAYDCAVDVANESAKQNEEAEATPEDPESTWSEMCRDHRDREQPKDGCEECNAETAEDEDED